MHPCTLELIQFRETDTHLNGPHRIQSGLYALTGTNIYRDLRLILIAPWEEMEI